MGKPSTITGTPDELERRVGPADAVAIGPGAMIGAGIFAALAPARGAGPGAPGGSRRGGGRGRPHLRYPGCGPTGHR